MVENPLFNAGDTGSIPVQGTEIPHVEKQLSLQATRREARMLQQIAPALQRDTPAHHNWRKPTQCNEELTHHNQDPA